MPKPDSVSKHYLWSSYREMLIEHVFVSEVMKYAWYHDEHIEVLKPQTDDAGYDLVLGCKGIYRHVQLKTKSKDATARSVNLNIALASPDKSGCIIWIVFDPDTIELGPYLWFGDLPGQPISNTDDLPVAKHNKANAQGQKLERPNIRKVKQSLFTPLENIDGVMHKLFGDCPS